MAYSYDPSGNRTVSVTAPLESGSFTTQASTNSQCSSSSTLPCYEVDSTTAQYPGAVTRTFYDSLGRAVETRTTGPDAGHDTVVFTSYNDAQHIVRASVPFEVNSGTSWVDPNSAVDYNGVVPGVNVTYLDALGRPIASDDPLLGSTQEPGITCPSISGNHTACAAYGLGSPNGDSTTYTYAQSLDPNNHASVGFTDALGRTRYTQQYSGLGLASLSSNIVQQKSLQYNALNEPTSITTTDLAPQSGQTSTSVTASASYDDLGRVTSVNDPDRGNHTLTYDPDGHVLTDVSGTRTIGANYDLLGRVGCVQDAAPTINAIGACTSGTHPSVQNTYDTTVLGTQGLTDFPVGRLTQSVATTYYPDSTSATVTRQAQYDQRGRPIIGQMTLTWPGSWGITTPLPTYQLLTSYNDANQPTTVTTSTNPAGQGYTTTNVYDSTTGALIGLSNTGSPNANVATLTFTPRAQINTIAYLTTASTGLSSEQYSYDANLRPTGATATWLSGSGTSGTILSQNRTYDPASNVTSLSTTLAAVPGVSGSGGSETQNFCYDEQNRLIWAGNSGSQPSAGNGTCGSGTLTSSLTGASYGTSYVYTHLGQLWQGPQGNSGTPSQYLYCDSTHPHQLTGLYQSGSTCSTKTGQSYASSYDAWGNVTSRTVGSTTATLSYDGLDRLTKYDAGSNGQEQYVYDAGGNRVLRRSTSSGTTMTVYAFGLEEHSYNGSGGHLSDIYYYSLGGMLVGESTSSGTNMFLTDALGSVIETISAAPNSAAVQGNQVYGPYGSSRYQQGTMGTAKGFTGQYTDTVTGLDYYNARYYDPVVGLFLSVDKVSGNMQGMDPYAYVGDNPETKNDPTGQKICDASGQCAGVSPPAPSSPPSDSCTQTNCSVTVNKHHYTTADLYNLTLRRQFLADFYAQFARGYDTAELGFFDYLLSSGRLRKVNGYWNFADFRLAVDQLMAAFDLLHHQSGQSRTIRLWIVFVENQSINRWWAAHNASIADADQQARDTGVYGAESPTEQAFINETVHVLGAIQNLTVSESFLTSWGAHNGFLGWLLGPQTGTTGFLTTTFYPHQYTDESTNNSLNGQEATAIKIGAGLLGPIGAVVAFGVFRLALL